MLYDLLSFFEWVETSLQNLFGIRKHHDAGPDLREQQVGINGTLYLVDQI
jgi:hypothetical protein